MKKVKKIPNCCSYNSPGFTYSQPFQTDAQMVLDYNFLMSTRLTPGFFIFSQIYKSIGKYAILLKSF